MLTFALCFAMGKAHEWGDIPKMQVWTQLSLLYRPLILGMVWMPVITQLWMHLN
jgi:hypothetical protein